MASSSFNKRARDSKRALTGIIEGTPSLMGMIIKDESSIVMVVSFASLPKVGDPLHIYIDESSNIIYRWNEPTLQYVVIGTSYVHPDLHDPSDINQDEHNRFVSDEEKSNWNNKQDDIGYIPLDSSLKGSANGLAELDLDGRLPSVQMPVLPTPRYIHVQAIAASSWIINHNLNRFPHVSVTDSSGNLVMGTVEHVDNNTVIVNFSAGFAGEAHLS